MTSDPKTPGPRRAAPPATRHAPLATRLKSVKLLLCDVDGVLTDASVFIGGEQEIKRFDILDGLGLVLLRRAVVAVAVANGVAETKAVAHYVTKSAGGHGAVREVAELILKAQNKWTRLIADYAA